MAAKKKVIATVAAVATSAALLLGGTFAWQSINQTALNEASDVVNPGGRLHDDFDGSDKNVYVENFAEDEIFARVRFDEYFEIIMNYDADNPDAQQTKKDVITTYVNDEGNEVEAVREDTSTYVTHIFGEENATDDYWDWTMGSADSEPAYYMPTFNLNKDSLAADVNGVFNGANFDITDKDDGDQYASYVDYSVAENQTKEGYEIYDGDTNNVDELSRDHGVLNELTEAVNDIIDNGTHSQYYNADNLVLTDAKEEHTAAQVNAETDFIAMADWDGTSGPYWVYDTDGWCYWAQPIGKGETTGLLMDGIALDEVMDDTWYYAINVVAQFVTADDVGKVDGTGFYADDDNAPSTDAEDLLKTIGVFSVEDEYEGGEEDVTGYSVDVYPSKNSYTPNADDSIDFRIDVYDSDWNYAELDNANVSWSVTGDENASITTNQDGSGTLIPGGSILPLTVTVTYTAPDGTAYTSEPITLYALYDVSNSLTLDNKTTSVVHPGNKYTLAYTGEVTPYSFTIIEGNNIASINNNTLTITDDAAAHTRIGIKVNDSNNEVAEIVYLTVTHDVIVKATSPNNEERVLESTTSIYDGITNVWVTALQKDTISVYMGDDNVMTLSDPSAMEWGDEDINNAIIIDETEKTAKLVKPGITVSANATYSADTLKVVNSVHIDVEYYYSVSVNYEINGINMGLADDTAIFLKQGDTIAFSATSDNTESSPSAFRWFIGENGNSPTHNSSAFGEFKGVEYPDAGVSTNTTNTYSIENVSNMESQLDYHFYVSAEDHNEAWFQVIYGTVQIDGPDTIAPGESKYYSSNDLQGYDWSINSDAPATIDKYGCLSVSEDAESSTVITITATPNGHSGNILTKEVTVG